VTAPSNPSVWLRVPVAVALAFFALPILGLLLRAPWSELAGHLLSRPALDALRLSIQCSLSAAVLAAVLGLPLAVWLAGPATRLRSAARALVTLPMVLPPVVAGVALLLAYGRSGLLGRPIDDLFGVALPFSTPAVVVAETYVAMPFFVLTVESGLRSFDRRYAEVAASLGASPWRVFRTVTLPMIAPAVRTGLLVAFARALGEFGATITFAGNLAGTTRNLPLAVYTALESDVDSAIALSLLLVVVSATVLVVTRSEWTPRWMARTGAEAGR
jgi:molybdate transport system permease protein